MRRALLMVVGTVAGLVLLLTFRTHAVTSATNPPAAIASSDSTSSSTSSSSSTPSSTTRTVTGNAVDTRYGAVQVRITLKGSKLTAVTVIQAPNRDPRDQQINSYALPVLNQEALSAQSANIDGVSGATYTSDGYIQSLQSALDKFNA
jgi:uncharacterized protein with FMN-binding domain